MPDNVNDLMYEALDGGGDQLHDRARMLVGSTRERFYENYATFDTTNVWQVVEGAAFITGPLGGAAAGSAPYLNINTGVGVNARTVLLSRSTFSGPLDLRYQVTASQRIVNNSFRIGFVEVDENGNIVTSTAIATAPAVLNARNASFSEQSGTTATTGSMLLRAAGSALQTVAAAYGTAFTTVATGTGPNFISATTYGLVQERDRVIARAIPKDSLAASGLQFANDTIVPNPGVRYKLCIIVENGAVAPASATDWRIHVINLLESTRVEISPRNGGLYDGNKAMPVAIIGGATALGGALTSNVGVNAISFNNIYFNDSTTAQAAAATVTGTARDVGAAAGSNHRYTAFNAMAFADQPGTMRVEVSNDNTTWRRITADVTVAANTPVVLSVPTVTRYYRVVYVNGATLQTAFMLNTSFTGA